MTTWKTVITAEFDAWFKGLDAALRIDVAAKALLLGQIGPTLGRPHADTVKGSRHANMKELRIKRQQTRVFFAFDPDRAAVLLVGGSKVGDGRFYEKMIRQADRLLDSHLASLAKGDTTKR